MLCTTYLHGGNNQVQADSAAGHDARTSPKALEQAEARRIEATQVKLEELRRRVRVFNFAILMTFE